MGKPKSKSVETVIDDRHYLSQQSWYRERIVTWNGRRLRYEIRVNAYDFQSWGKVDVWRDDKWSRIHTLAGEQLKTKASYVDRRVQIEAFDEDIAELRRVAYAVLEAP